VPGGAGEAEVAEVARAAMAGFGMDVVVREVAPGRPNVVGVLEGRERGPSMIWCGHLDTVGVDGMTDPFTPRVEHGRLYGRGAQDMKGGVAAMIAAAGVLAPNWSRGRLIVAGVADEEHMSLGAEALVRDTGADMAVVTEPTDLTLAVGHKGFAWLRVTCHGRAAHGSRPAEGRDAIAHKGRVLVALEALDRDLQARAPQAFQGTGSVHASFISGGREMSVYPDRCVLDIERRTVSGDDGPSVLREMQALVARLHDADPDFRADVELNAERPPYRLDPSHVLPAAIAASLTSRQRPAGAGGMSFWTDAAILAGAGIPSVLFGPGGAGLHSAVEYVNVDDVYVCRDVLVDVARRITGSP
jgi:acetylornithine deacetylase